MKNSILFGASILALGTAAPALAQSAPTAPATPTAAPGTPECAGATNNCSLVDQDGTSLNATVTQSGSDNVSDIDQINGSVGAIAEVTQSGSSNDSYILQSDAGIAGFPTEARVIQTGTGGESVILQTDTRNHTAIVTQDGASTSFISQNRGSDAVIEVFQSGDDNTSIAFQEGAIRFGVGNGNPSNNDGVTQIGSFNNSEIYQGDFAGGTLTEGQRARVTQNGINNDSFVSQNIARTLNAIQTVTISQQGEDNVSSAVQTGFRAGQDILVNQFGSDNLSRVVQSDIDGGNGGNQVTVTQNDDGNDSFVDQSGGAALATVTQNSTDTSGLVGTSVARDNVFDGGTDNVRANFSRIAQQGIDPMQATVTQTGSGNRSDVRQDSNSGFTTAAVFVGQEGTLQNSDIIQTNASLASVSQGVGDPGSSDNYSFVSQSGNDAAFVTQISTGNESLVAQSGGVNEAYVTQTGDAGISSVFQAGVDSVATLDQSGTGNESQIDQGFAGGSEDNDANVTQSGSGNFSGVQQGFNSASLENDADVLQTGDANFSVVVQDGNLNVATVNQLTDGNVSFVTQNGIGNTATVNQ